uniref:Major facilitator superfamily (MFS) profile domain-containing protein n=1 Tax=Setaria digitata TaxID=48799 RepID=A0A915PIX0_9BILA
MVRVTTENTLASTNAVYPTSASTIKAYVNVEKFKKRYIGGTREEGNFTLGCLKLFHTRTRFVLVILVLLCLASVWSNILAFNFVIVCMNNEENVTMERAEGGSLVSSMPGLEVRGPLFTPQQRTYLTSAVAAAALVANFPLVSLVNRFGIRFIFTILGVLSSLATCLLPLAIIRGYYFSLGARVLQGISFAVSFPVIGAFTSQWTYYKQNGLFISVLVAYLQLSPALTMPLSGALCSSTFSWPSVCYSHGVVSLMLFIIFGIFFRDSPEKHPLVSEQERQKIAVGKTECSRADINRIPYYEILKTGSVWAVWIAAVGNFTCVNMLFLYSPNYLHNVLGMRMADTGIAAAAPPLLQFMIKLAAGFSSDKLSFLVKCLSETGKLRLYNSIAFIGSALFLSILSFIPAYHGYAATVCLGFAAGFLGFTTGGFFKAAPLVSKHFSPFVTGNVSLGLDRIAGITITMLVVPVMTWGLAPANDIVGWQKIFLTTAGVLLSTNFLFCFMCSAEPALWTTDEFVPAALQFPLTSP